MQRVHLFILLLCASLQPSIGLPDGYSHRAMADRELSVTLAIPCVSRHIQFLEGLFVDIVSQTLMPVEVDGYNSTICTTLSLGNVRNSRSSMQIERAAARG